MKNHRVVVTRNGGPEVIELIEEDLRAPGQGEARVRVLASGVAFGDVMKRHRLPGMPKPPFTPGYDLVGEIDALGPGCEGWEVGRRVAAYVFNGANTEYLNVSSDRLCPVPADLDPAVAVALLLNYVTAYQMLHRVARVSPGHRILVHGAGGAVGTALLQLGGLAELELYGTASARKHSVVREHGATPIDYENEDVAERIRALTGGKGLDAVFDPIGGSSFVRSHRLLRRGGILVGYGASVALTKGSGQALASLLWIGLYKLLPDGRRVAFYGIRDQLTIKEDYAKLLELHRAGKLRPIIAERLPLREARRAHELIESRAVSGKIVLV